MKMNEKAPITEKEKFGRVKSSAEENKKIIENAFGGSFDILVKSGKFCGKTAVFANCDGLTNSRSITEAVVKPVLFYDGKAPKENSLDFIMTEILCGTEQKKEKDLDKALIEILRGNLLLFIDGEAECVVIGVQSIPQRSIDTPEREVQEHGSRESFVESVKTNLALIRKRICTIDFKADSMEIGTKSRTKVVICYMANCVNEQTLNEVKTRLKNVTLETLLGAGYLQNALDTKRKSMFTMVGLTERPDTLVAKVNEGKVCVLVDGTPYALVVPRLFIENFQTLDDYLDRPYFSAFMRTVRIISFMLSIFLPGLFVAIGLFHQELLTDDFLLNIIMMESNTLFSLTVEALIIHFVYEVVREAGIRMPKAVGHAVSIVGALVIGDAAVTAGLIGAPMLIIVASTAITSLVVSDLYQPIAVLRIVFIIVAGFTGLYGVIIGAAALILNLSAMTDYGVPFLAPLTPYNKGLWRDTITRMNITRLSKKPFDINNLKNGE